MSLQNEMRRQQKVNFEFKAKRLRGEIENLARIICINLDCGLTRPEALPINEVDSQWDEMKNKWADLTIALAEIARLKAELE
jgi:hypothetical protein